MGGSDETFNREVIMGQILQTSPREEEEKKAKPTQQMTISVLRILYIAGWFGLFTGLLEAFYLVGWRQLIGRNRINLSQHVLWMAPVTELVIFVLLGSILALLVWQFPRLFTLRIFYFILAFVSFLALLLIVPQLNIYAKYLLAIGLSVQTSRMIGKNPYGFYRFVRISSVVLIAAVLGLALFTFTKDAAIEHQAIAKLPPAPLHAPNVILITLDTVRAKNLSLYGYERQTTPQLEKLAQDSIVFDQAIATASWTLPSHGSIFTGQYPHEFSSGWTKPFKSSHETLAEELGQRGYESAGFVANLLYCSEVGLDRGMVHYEDYPISVGQMILSASLGRAISNTGFIRRTIDYHNTLNRKRAEEVNDDFLDWLSSRDQERPYFAFLNYFDAHVPILPPAPFNEQFGSSKIDIELYDEDGVEILSPNLHDWTEQDILIHRNAYDSSIAYLDYQIGILFNKLSERGQFDNTVVIVTADHGELFGEHGIYGHGNSLYIETLHVPLLIRFPARVPKNVRVRQPVSLRDIPATVMDLIGEESQTSFPGESLGRYFDQTKSEPDSDSRQMMFSELDKAPWMRPWYPASKYKLKSIVTEQYYYVRNGNGTEELYDRKNDPNELQNLAQSAEKQELLEEFRSAMKDTASSK